MDDCIFCRLVRGELPISKIAEDEHFFIGCRLCGKACQADSLRIDFRNLSLKAGFC